MPPVTIQINRAPVLTLWATVVGEVLGFNPQEALSLGKAVAGLNAQTKGRRLGIFKPSPDKVRSERDKKRGEDFWIELCGRAIPAVNTDDGVRAVVKDKPIDPAPVDRYLRSKFGDALDSAREAMEGLAKSVGADQLSERAFGLYEQFRPQIPAGVPGWGAKGELNLERLRSMALRHN